MERPLTRVITSGLRILAADLEWWEIHSCRKLAPLSSLTPYVCKINSISRSPGRLIRDTGNRSR